MLFASEEGALTEVTVVVVLVKLVVVEDTVVVVLEIVVVVDVMLVVVCVRWAWKTGRTGTRRGKRG